MKTYSQEELNNIIELNRLYTIGDPKGKKANLRDVYLRGADLRWANLVEADTATTDEEISLGYRVKEELDILEKDLEDKHRDILLKDINNNTTIV